MLNTNLVEGALRSLALKKYQSFQTENPGKVMSRENLIQDTAAGLSPNIDSIQEGSQQVVRDFLKILQDEREHILRNPLAIKEGVTEEKWGQEDPSWFKKGLSLSHATLLGEAEVKKVIKQIQLGIREILNDGTLSIIRRRFDNLKPAEDGERSREERRMSRLVFADHIQEEPLLLGDRALGELMVVANQEEDGREKLMDQWYWNEEMREEIEKVLYPTFLLRGHTLVELSGGLFVMGAKMRAHDVPGLKPHGQSEIVRWLM